VFGQCGEIAQIGRLNLGRRTLQTDDKHSKDEASAAKKQMQSQPHSFHERQSLIDTSGNELTRFIAFHDLSSFFPADTTEYGVFRRAVALQRIDENKMILQRCAVRSKSP
jgi:hypothetical protein